MSAPLELIVEGRWHHALLTTYSLSLSFFESHILKVGLKKNGCREVWVVADLDGYSDSLAERQSKAVGQDYHLVPVALPRGVFHPKCIFLSGPDGTVLIVGSGNLTFGGHGRNIEVAEIFHAESQPAVFGQFADYLASLRARSDFVNPDSGWIDRFQALARQASGGVRPGDQGISARLVHSVERPIVDQVTELCSANGGTKAVRLLSPFYDNHAEAVQWLSSRLGSVQPVIGLISRQESRSGYPFNLAPPPLKVSAAVVEVERPNRRLHAKWLEIDLAGGKQLTLTGSVNATRQALCSTNNIELGVLRIEDAKHARRLDWKRTALPTKSAPNDYQVPGLGSRVLVHARMSETGQVQGQMFGAKAVSGRWEASLSRPDGHVHQATAEINQAGEFILRLNNARDFERSAGLQLRLVRDNVEARCWVQNDWLIEFSELSDVPTESFLSLFRGDAQDEDELVFLDFLNEGLDEFASHWTSTGRPASRTADTTEKPRVERTIAIDALAPREAEGLAGQIDLGGIRSPRVLDMLTRLMRQFEEDPVQHDLTSTSEDSGDEVSDDEAEADTEAVERRRSYRRSESALARFREAIKTRVAGSLVEVGKRKLLGLWLVVELRMRFRGDDGLVEARRFAREWLMFAVRHVRWSGETNELNDRVLWIAAALGASARADGDALALVGVHESLEDFLVGRDRSTALCVPPNHPKLLLSLAPSSSTLDAGLEAVLAARTRRQELDLIRQTVAHRTTLPEGLAVLSTTAGRALREALSAHRAVRLLELKADRSGCPHCYLTLPSADLTTIRSLRFGRCHRCESFLYDLSSHS